MPADLAKTKEELLAELEAARRRIAELELSPHPISCRGQDATLLDELEAIIYVADMESYEVLYANKHTRESFGENIVGGKCWQTLQVGMDGPCPFCTNDKLLDDWGRPTEGVNWELENTRRNTWYRIHDKAILWDDGRLVRSQIAMDITEQVRTNEKLQQLNEILGKRVKELRCIYSISQVGADPKKSVAEILQSATALIPPGWQYPKITCARIVMNGESFVTENFRESTWTQSQEIVVHGKCVGAVEVFYLKETPEFDEGPFLKEERELIDIISARVGKIIERRRAEEALQKAHAELEQKVKERTVKLKNSIDQLVEEISQRKRAEEKLKAVIEQSGEGIILADVAGRYVLVNPAFCIMTGYHEKELLAMSVWDMNPPGHKLKLFPKVVRGGSGQMEQEFLKKDGSHLLAEIGGGPVDFGGDSYFLGIVRDITERTRLEHERRLLEEKYSKAFNSSLDALTISTLDTGVFLEVNRGFELLSGYSREETVGKTSHDLNLWWNVSDWESAIDMLRREDRVENVELSFRSMSGACIHGLVAAEIIHLREGPCILSSFRDITERKKTEKVLQQQAREMKEVNIALTVLLKKRDQERQALEENSLNTLETLVFPFLDKLLGSALSPSQKSYLTTVTSNLNSIYSPFSSCLTRYDKRLTPGEIHIAEYIRQGKSTKEAALLLSLSEKTVATHRRNIRTKLGILNEKANLCTFLQSLEKSHD